MNDGRRYGAYLIAVWRKRLKFIGRTSLVVLYLSGVVCGSGVAEEIDGALGRMARLRENKDKAEEMVRLLKVNKPKVSGHHLKKCKVLYIEAMSSFNGWIEEAKNDVLTEGAKAEVQARESSLRIAVNKNLDFMDYANGLLFPREKGPPYNVDIDVAGIVGEFLGFVNDRLDKHSAKRSRESERLVETLEDLKWKRFDEL